MDTKTRTGMALPAAEAGEPGVGWSALFDGECTREELDALLASEDAARRDAIWDTYRCIGDALRAHDAAQPRAADPAFVRAVMARVQAEPHSTLAVGQPQRAALPPAANAALWRWRALAGVAALAALLSVAWPLLQPSGGEPATLATAAWPATVPAVAPAAASVPAGRDAQLEEFMAAHRAWGNASALQAPAGFLRTVAYEAAGR